MMVCIYMVQSSGPSTHVETSSHILRKLAYPRLLYWSICIKQGSER